MNIKEQHKALKEEVGIMRYKLLNAHTREQALNLSKEYMAAKQELEHFELEHKEELQ